jgi:chemotaxis protein MotA
MSSFFDPMVAFGIVGCSLVAFAMAFQKAQIKTLWFFVTDLVRGNHTSSHVLVKQIIKVAELHRDHASELDGYLTGVDAFLREGTSMIRDGILDDNQVTQILRARVYADSQFRNELAKKLRSFAQVPVSFGLTGALVAIYLYFRLSVGEAPRAELVDMVSFGFLSLIYGCGVGYVLFSPFSRTLEASASTSRLRMTLVVVGCRLIAQRSNPVLIAEELNSYLTPDERVDWREVVRSVEKSA